MKSFSFAVSKTIFSTLKFWTSSLATIGNLNFFKFGALFEIESNSKILKPFHCFLKYFIRKNYQFRSIKPDRTGYSVKNYKTWWNWYFDIHSILRLNYFHQLGYWNSPVFCGLNLGRGLVVKWVSRILSYTNLIL